ncbi:glycerol-3-phosphate dehydrogenase/oxidase [Nitrosomonas sp. Is37]|uniref:glycerol-3-phosphate dehydrogenase/oxidase n=1 Tax=Nitrosomonas sp. Is37 TaxID=3080535 RepID=UPI00294ACF87|nr:FAD-dependent oxidoreductase [Nitrosomonas sp. Is37]MDV6344124.1 FAD-dependent oxidoreductase [Nitrosomonas sp. Is37]
MPAFNHYDIVIVGGGIQGAAVAQAAAARGYTVLVLEKTALAAATSSRSSKLIHGGLRYLENGHFALVHESLRERSEWLRLAPSLVRLSPFYIPVYRETSRSSLVIRAGLSLYALLAGGGSSARFRSVPKSEWEQLDGLTTEGLKQVFQYWDAQTDDRLLTQALMHSAQSLGAELLCPAEFIHATLSSSMCEIDYLQGDRINYCRAAVLVNAAGPWVNKVLHRIDPLPVEYPIDLVQGTHLVLEGCLNRGCYYLESPADRRAVFVLPWYQHTLLGTTETLFNGDPEESYPLVTEETYLLDCFHHYFPERNRVVREKFSGLRVLPASQGAAFRRSREIHLQCDSPQNPRLVSIYGGKLTVCRATAQKVLHTIMPTLPHRTPKADVSRLMLESP